MPWLWPHRNDSIGFHRGTTEEVEGHLFHSNVSLLQEAQTCQLPACPPGSCLGVARNWRWLCSTNKPYRCGDHSSAAQRKQPAQNFALTQESQPGRYKEQAFLEAIHLAYWQMWPTASPKFYGQPASCSPPPTVHTRHTNSEPFPEWPRGPQPGGQQRAATGALKGRQQEGRREDPSARARRKIEQSKIAKQKTPREIPHCRSCLL